MSTRDTPRDRMLERFVPPDLDLAIYDAARQWTAKRWQGEIGIRRFLFDFAEQSPNSRSWVLRRLDQLLDRIDSPDYDCLPTASSTWIVCGTIPFVHPLHVRREPIPGVDGAQQLVIRDQHADSLGDERYAVLAVDLTAPLPAVLAAFDAWFKTATGQAPQRGQRANAIRKATLRRWAVNHYPAYWDLKLRLMLGGRPAPTSADWRDLLADDAGCGDREKIPAEPDAILAGEYDAELQRAVDRGI